MINTHSEEYYAMSTLKTFTLVFATALAIFSINSSFATEKSTDSVITIEKRQNIRVVYDVKDDIWDAGIGKALYYVRGLIESYKAMGVPEKQLHISIVLHGPTVYWLLNEETYQIYKNDPFDYNPNEKVVQELLEHGVSVEVCNSTLKGKGWKRENLLPGVTIVRDAYTRLIDLQNRNYAYIRF
jgi:intracellular sulfur oxidation DsrE/DsrF family protein